MHRNNKQKQQDLVYRRKISQTTTSDNGTVHTSLQVFFTPLSNSLLTDPPVSSSLTETKMTQKIRETGKNNDKVKPRLATTVIQAALQKNSVGKEPDEIVETPRLIRTSTNTVKSETKKTSGKNSFYRPKIKKQEEEFSTMQLPGSETDSLKPTLSSGINTKEEIQENFNDKPAKQTTQQQGNSTEKLEETPSMIEKAKFVGPYADNYADLFYFITSKMDPSPSLAIANFSNDQRLYLEETDDVKNAAQIFLRHFWANHENIEANLLLQNAKHKKEARYSHQPIMASCANFVLANIDSKRYCFIGLSIPHEDNEFFYQCLGNCVKEINGIQDIEYVLVNGSTGNFSKLISAIAEKVTFATFRTCAEKTLASLFTKLWMSGTNLYLQGAVSVLVYPFKNKERYGRGASSVENCKILAVKPFLKNGKPVNILTVSENLYTPMIMCCQACQETKKDVIKIWHGAKLFFEWNNQNNNNNNSSKNEHETKKNPIRTTSPIRRSVVTESSLRTNAVFTTDISTEPPKNETSRKWQKNSKSVF